MMLLVCEADHALIMFPLVFARRTHEVRLTSRYNLGLMIIVTVRISYRLTWSSGDTEVSAALSLVIHSKGEHFMIVGQHHDMSLASSYLGDHMA